jgi:hypothetical protein
MNPDFHFVLAMDVVVPVYRKRGEHFTNQCVYESDRFADFPKTVGPSVLTDRNAVGPTISKYISDQMSGKT